MSELSDQIKDVMFSIQAVHGFEEERVRIETERLAVEQARFALSRKWYRLSNVMMVIAIFGALPGIIYAGMWIYGAM